MCRFAVQYAGKNQNKSAVSRYAIPAGISCIDNSVAGITMHRKYERYRLFGCGLHAFRNISCSFARYFNSVLVILTPQDDAEDYGYIDADEDDMDYSDDEDNEPV